MSSHLILFFESLTDVTESVIDRIPHPDLRDRLILLRGMSIFFTRPMNKVFVLTRHFTGRFNLVDCLHDFSSSVTIHGDDVLAHANWEIGETWLRRYGSVDFYLSEFCLVGLTNPVGQNTDSWWTQAR
jgi:hypothetical protein